MCMYIHMYVHVICVSVSRFIYLDTSISVPIYTIDRYQTIYLYRERERERAAMIKQMG